MFIGTKFKLMFRATEFINWLISKSRFLKRTKVERVIHLFVNTLTDIQDGSFAPISKILTFTAAFIASMGQHLPRSTEN